MESDELRDLNERAANGDAEAQFTLARRCEYGIGEVSANADEAVEWYRKAADQGHVEAQYRLGRCFWQGIGVREDKQEALKWYSEAAEHGHFHAKNFVQTPEERARWFYEAAENGDAEDQYILALRNSAIYSAGLHGKPEDRKSAAEEIAKWFYKAAEQGHVEAQFRIGECYLHGFGAPENKEEAFRWLRKAAEKNHLEAQRRLDG